MAVFLMPSGMFPQLLDSVIDRSSSFEKAFPLKKRKRQLAENNGPIDSKRVKSVLRYFPLLFSDRTVSFRTLPTTISDLLEFLKITNSVEEISTGYQKCEFFATCHLLGKEECSKMRISPLNMSNYKPEELNVNPRRRTSSIREKEEISKGGKQSSRPSRREFQIAERMITDYVKPSPSKNRQLTTAVSKALTR
ncbi:hypothetical protein NECAME_17595 [Necator americanus]|uniref:Uncharacterized protein n=1 Tax=Necator americanus TaxID=51031 RepID=W2TLH9_NECAM|nr:hypothetical protein NECAME_17595 [Necator americanus]ETN82955.1 hypothetical protein NECAME_17595 [Necator americanus]